MTLFRELKRRNVFRVAIAYIIIGWLILQVGEVLAPALLLPLWVNSMLAFFILLGFPLALFFSWAFEMTPEGLKKERDVVRDSSITHTTGRKLDFAIIGLLVMALAYFAYDKFVVQERPDQPVAETEAQVDDGVHSIAVLPLADMSPGGDHEYFSDGLTEELLNILAKIKELQVAGRTSSFAFKGKNEDLRTIGEKLNVDHILEGSVRKDEARNKVRITLQLINTEDGYHLWSETYDRDLDDIFTIQEEVALEVAKALRITLLGEDEARLEQTASTDIDIYDTYLQGLKELRKSGYVSLDNAVNLFQQVLLQDPTYTPAKLGLVAAWGNQASTGAITLDEAMMRGMPLIEALLESDSHNSEVHHNHANYLNYGHDDFEGAEQAYLRALELDPRNANALKSYGRMLYDFRQVERGMEIIDAAVEIEPYDISVLFDQCQTNAHRGNLEKAIAACRIVQEIAPDGPQGYYGEALAHIYNGDMPRALLGYSRALEKDPEDFEMIAAMGIFWIALGDGEQARLWLEKAEAIGAGQPVPISTRIIFYNFREQHDLAGNLAAQALARDMDDRHGTNYFFRRANAAYAVRSGDYESGLAPYRELLPWAFESELNFPQDASDFSDDLIHIATLIKLADPFAERSEELLAFTEKNARVYHPSLGDLVVPHRLASINAVRGNLEQANHHLREYQEGMVLSYWRPEIIDAPAFITMNSDPDYNNIITEIEALTEQHRAEAHALLEIDG